MVESVAGGLAGSDIIENHPQSQTHITILYQSYSNGFSYGYIYSSENTTAFPNIEAIILLIG